VWAELAFTSVDSVTGRSLAYDSHWNFIPGTSARPFLEGDRGGYLGIAFEVEGSIDYGDGDTCTAGAGNSLTAVRLHDVVVTVFSLEGMQPPILTEDD
jgi:hypothetical protein